MCNVSIGLVSTTTAEERKSKYLMKLYNQIKGINTFYLYANKDWFSRD